MPRYPCTRCGETVDTGPSFSPPLDILCPDCRGETVNLPEARPAPAPPIASAAMHPGYAAAPPPLPHGPAERGIAWWAPVVISHLLAVPTLIVVGVAENGKDPVLQGTLGGVLFGIFMLLVLDVVSLAAGLVIGGILRLFKLNFARALAIASSIFLLLSTFLILLGFLAPEELSEEGESALPKVEAVE